LPWSSPFAWVVAVVVSATFVLTGASWIHSCLRRDRRLAPVLRRGGDRPRPPFLPDVAAKEGEDDSDSSQGGGESGSGPPEGGRRDDVTRIVGSAWRRLWGERGEARALAARRAERTSVMGRLLVERARRGDGDDEDDRDSCTAVVTGASRGIGRAMAVELARYRSAGLDRIVLIARDADRLVALARDLRDCYGVRCSVLPADLAVPGAGERVYRTLRKANILVDILIK